MHDFRKGVQVQTKAQPVKTGVAKPDGPKRKVFRMAAGFLMQLLHSSLLLFEGGVS